MNFFTIAGKYGQHGKFCTVLPKYLKKEEEKIASIFIEELLELHYKEGSLLMIKIMLCEVKGNGIKDSEYEIFGRICKTRWSNF